MNKTIFHCYNDFIAPVVIGSCERASRYLSKRENCGDFGTSSQTRTQNRTQPYGIQYVYFEENNFLFQTEKNYPGCTI